MEKLNYFYITTSIYTTYFTQKDDSEIMFARQKSWYQRVEFLSLSLSIFPLFLSRVSLWPTSESEEG